MNAKILEIFKSVQGEGPYAGVNQVFVRFFKCNIHCVWCDTPHSIGDTSDRSEEFDLGKLARDIDALIPGCHSLSLTGGEPLVQADVIKAFLSSWKNPGVKIYLETNGILPEKLKTVIDDVDIVSMDIKMPSSTQCGDFWNEHEEFLKTAVQKETFVKAVVSCDTIKDDIVKTVDVVAKVAPETLLILQPNTYDLKNGVMNKCQDYFEYALERLPNVRIMPQMHKFMKLR